MRLADASGPPLDYRDYAGQVREFFEQSQKTAKRRKLDSGYDPAPMNKAIAKFSEEAGRIENARQEAVSEIERSRNDANTRARAKLKRINDALLAAERSLTDDRGLRGRSWYTHQIYAPGTYTGYAAQPLPDFRQALDDRNTTNAKEALDRIVDALNRASETLRKGRD